MRPIKILIVWLLSTVLLIAETTVSAEAEWLPKLLEKTFFTDRIATATIDFGQSVELPSEAYPSNDEVEIIEIQLQTNAHGKQQATIQFLPLKTGPAKIPRINFRSDEQTIRTSELQIHVSAPIHTKQIQLSLTPTSKTIYVQQPLRVDLVFKSSIQAARFKQLQLHPECFNHPDIEVVVPRSTIPNENQIGIPIGGRRLIAEHIPAKDPDAMGTLQLPLYLRFTKPGIYKIERTRVECALLKKPLAAFAPYQSSYFNNGFFETVDKTRAYDRAYNWSSTFEIEVLPLPNSEHAQTTFSGLFHPLKIEVQATPTSLQAGELIELDWLVKTDAPHGMIDLPTLKQFSQLKKHFYIDPSVERYWHPEGTRFRTRIRPLSDAIQSIPSIPLQVFDASSAEFTTYWTQPIALQVTPTDAENPMNLKAFKEHAIPLIDEPSGIGHNLKPNKMNHLLNSISTWVTDYFWLLMLLPPSILLCARPYLRELHKRRQNPKYRKHRIAYRQLQKTIRHQGDVWPIFIQFLATTTDQNSNAWTVRNTTQAMTQIGASESDISKLKILHNAADLNQYTQNSEPIDSSILKPLARKILRLSSKSVFLLGLCLCLLPSVSKATTWQDAEASFKKALEQSNGSQAATLSYKEAALQFEALAQQNQYAAEAWLNAGNAWFQAAATGRAIAAYRQASELRPFDQKLAKNLATARSLVLNQIAEQRGFIERMPQIWLNLTNVCLNLLLCIAIACSIVSQTKLYKRARVVFGLLLLVAIGLQTWKSIQYSQTEGVIIADDSYAKKGPSFAYANAFTEPLQDGLEFTLLEQRDSWLRIQLHDQRQCWIHPSTAQLLDL